MWTKGASYPRVIQYVCHKLKDYVGHIVVDRCEDLVERVNGQESEGVGSEEWKKESCYFEGRMEVDVRGDVKNGGLRELVMVLIYSYGVRLGIGDESEFIEKWNQFILQNYQNDRMSSHISSILLRLC